VPKEIPKMKYCHICKQWKPIEEFHRRYAGKDWPRHSGCKACRKISQHNRYIIPKNKRRNRELRNRYNSTEKGKISRMFYGALNRAKKRGMHFGLIREDINNIPIFDPFNEIVWSNGGNGYSKYSASIDVIKPELGYIPTNIYIIPKYLNTMKSNGNARDLYALNLYFEELIDKGLIEPYKPGK